LEIGTTDYNFSRKEIEIMLKTFEMQDDMVKKICLLKYYEELTNFEISQVLDITNSTIQVTMKLLEDIVITNLNNYYNIQHNLGITFNDKNKLEIIHFESIGLTDISTTKETFPVNKNIVHQNDNLFFHDTKIKEFEEMLNDKNCHENIFQNFFTKNPEFIMGLEYKEIHPQLFLYRDNKSKQDFIPDFIMEPVSNKYCDIIELKKPNYKNGIIKGRNKPDRADFRAFVNNLETQLLSYQEYFDDEKNRTIFYERYKLKAYKPKLICVIGRQSDFINGFERQQIENRHNKINFLTYDDILDQVKQYRNYK
jgi:hypothetical protein